QEDPGHQGGPWSDEPGLEGSQGPGRQRSEGSAGGRQQGNRRQGQGGPRGRRCLRHPQVVVPGGSQRPAGLLHAAVPPSAGGAAAFVLVKTPRGGGPKVPYVVYASVSDALRSVELVRLDLFGAGVCAWFLDRGSVLSRDS